MKVGIAEAKLPRSGALVVGVLHDRQLLATARSLDSASDGALSRAMKSSRFTGAKGQWLELLAPAGVAADRLLLAGYGKAEELDALALEAIGGNAVQRMRSSGVASLTIACDPCKDAKIGQAEAAAHLAYGARLASYRFDKYRTKDKPESKPSLDSVTVTVKSAAAAKRAYAPLEKIADGVFFTRDLVTEPANIIYPATLARECRSLSKLGVKIQVLGEKQMQALGMGALLGVGQGSQHESQLVVMQWNGAGARSKPVAFVGKGVTFDTGGISLKPGAGMEQMKWDMGGSGVVIGLMKALAGRKAKVNAIGVVGLVENMPSHNAQRPGDVVKSMSGQTIEVLNTDAEGRLVLADALWYTHTKFKPQFMVDLATLTGAIMVALGKENAGLFSNNDELADRIITAGKAEGEGVWRMPLSEAYDKLIDCDIADMKNIGGRDGGSITAAQFLQRFVNGVPWAHLDIAGVTWSEKDAPTVPKGGTGWGVRTLDRLVRDHYEK